MNAKGFDEVVLKLDLTRTEMDEAIATFVDHIDVGDMAVFIYSGHGWSDGVQNYIVGTDAPKGGNREYLARVSIPLKNGTDGIIDDMNRKGAALKVTVVDACRDNPFTPVPGKRSVGLDRGLARIDPPTGTFIVFSAGAGQSALDRLSDSDPDPNSVFTRVFAPLLRSDDPLQTSVKATQQRAVALARSIHQDQQPAYYDEVIGSACLSRACIGTEVESVIPSEPQPPAPPIQPLESAAVPAPADVTPAPSPDAEVRTSRRPPPARRPTCRGDRLGGAAGPRRPAGRSTHGDWQVRCDTPAGAKSEQCVLMQFVTAEDRENVGLTVIVLKTADKKAKIMRILAPLGVLLPSGLGLKIDDTDMGRAGFVRCLPNGCVAEVILEDKLLTKLEGGKTRPSSSSRCRKRASASRSR